MNSNSTPYLSIVATSRNDNHGGDLTNRMKIFVNGLIHQTRKFQFSCELVMVEWNPPADKPGLSEILPKTNPEDFLTIRYVVVPSHIHDQMEFSERLYVFQMIAKNIGIRRARGEYVLCTNIDLLFSDQLFKFFADRKLEKNVFYRCKRCDIPNSIYEIENIEKQLEFAQNNVTKKLGKVEWFGISTTLFQKLMKMPLPSSLNDMIARLLISSLDKEACGDFTLMSKEDWIRIEGYPELEVYSLHIDSMGIIAAASIGIKQQILSPKKCTYHIAHTGGWEFQTAKERVLFHTNKPVLDWWSVFRLGVEIVRKGVTYSLNKSTWGLSDQDLMEK